MFEAVRLVTRWRTRKAVISANGLHFGVSNAGDAIVCDSGFRVSDMFLAGCLHCASVRVLEWALEGRTMAGVVGGVECSDGEGPCAYNVTVRLCVVLMQTRVWCLRAVWQHCASVCV